MASKLMEQIERVDVLPNSLAIWGFGQMGIGIKTPQTMLYVDLCLSDLLFEQHSEVWVRAYDPPVEPKAITNADYYLITHDHPDHLDPLTIGPIVKSAPQTKFVATGWCVEPLKELGIKESNIIVPPTLEPIELPDGDVRITAIPAAHYEKIFDENKGHRWLGYFIEANGVTVYHAGDTVIYEDYIETLKKLPRPDVAMLPINGRDYYREVEGPATGNLMPIEGARLASDLGWDTLIIGHNDMYPFNKIPFGDIVNALETVAPRQKYKVLQPGELLYYVK